MTVELHSNGSSPPDTGAVRHLEGSDTRRRILTIALSLMSHRGVDGTSMRDLASAAGLNVASLYHYFPSKRDLLEAVLVEQGFLPLQTPSAGANGERAGEMDLAHFLAEMLTSMFEVEDFVRLMVGESIRGDTTARSVGLGLFSTFQEGIETWVKQHRPDLAERSGAAEVSRLLSAMVLGIFVQHAGGVIGEDDDEGQRALSLQRAREAASILDTLDPPD
jgi:AcrR family transcriptional regulator